MRISLSSRSISSSSARTSPTMTVAMVAVTKARAAIPTSISAAPTMRPVAVAGTRSPYPTVVIVVIAHQSPSPTWPNRSGSSLEISQPASSTALPVTAATRPNAWTSVNFLRVVTTRA